MVTLRALQCLVALADEGSMTKAASSLYMSQPAFSHQIAMLEREFGTPVVERLNRGVRFTIAGLAAAEEARIALAAASRAVTVGRRAGEGLGGRLRIACAETMTPWMLVPVLRRWRSHWPEVELELAEYTSSDRMIEELMSNRTDLVVGPEPTRTSAHVEMLGMEEIVVVSAADHPFALADSVAVKELAGQPFVHYHPENGMKIWLDDFMASHRISLAVVLRTYSPRTAAQLAGAGVGVTIAPVSALVGRFAAEVRSLEPRVQRKIIAVTMTPADALVRRFIGDLKRVGLPRVDRTASAHRERGTGAREYEQGFAG